MFHPYNYEYYKIYHEKMQEQSHTAQILYKAGLTGPDLGNRTLAAIGAAMIWVGSRLKKRADRSIEPSSIPSLYIGL